MASNDSSARRSAAAMNTSDGSSHDHSLEPLRRMVQQLNRQALTEVERAARLTLMPKPTPSELRVSQLGFLRSILLQQEPDPGLGVPVIARKLYDRIRPSDAPSSEHLVKHY